MALRQIIIVRENLGGSRRRYDIQVCPAGEYPTLPDTFDIVYQDWPLSAHEVAGLLPLADAALREATRTGCFDRREYDSAFTRLRQEAAYRQV